MTTQSWLRYSWIAGLGLLLGLLREVVVAREFGLSAELDVYLVLTGFYLFFGMQVGNALEMVFISRSASHASGEDTVSRVWVISRPLLLANVAIVLSLLALLPSGLRLMFPEFTNAQHNLASALLVWFCVAIVLANFAGLFRAGLNVRSIFAPGLLFGSIVSACTIAGVLLLSADYGIHGMAAGFLAGNALGLVVMAAHLVRNLDIASLRKLAASGNKNEFLWVAAGVVLVAEVLYQAYLMLGRMYAANFEPGTISAFFFAGAFVAVPLAIVVLPLSTVLFPQLAKAYDRGISEGNQLLARFAVPVFALSSVLVVLVWLVADWLVTIVFVRGSFTQEDAELTASILSVLIVTLPFASIGRLVRNSLYSLGQYNAPVWSKFLCFVVLLLTAPTLMSEYGIRGLAIGIALAAIADVLAMIVLLRRER